MGIPITPPTMPNTELVFVPFELSPSPLFPPVVEEPPLPLPYVAPELADKPPKSVPETPALEKPLAPVVVAPGATPATGVGVLPFCVAVAPLPPEPVPVPVPVVDCEPPPVPWEFPVPCEPPFPLPDPLPLPLLFPVPLLLPPVVVLPPVLPPD